MDEAIEYLKLLNEVNSLPKHWNDETEQSRARINALKAQKVEEVCLKKQNVTDYINHLDTSLSKCINDCASIGVQPSSNIDIVSFNEIDYSKLYAYIGDYYKEVDKRKNERISFKLIVKDILLFGFYVYIIPFMMAVMASSNVLMVSILGLMALGFVLVKGNIYVYLESIDKSEALSLNLSSDNLGTRLFDRHPIIYIIISLIIFIISTVYVLNNYSDTNGTVPGPLIMALLDGLAISPIVLIVLKSSEQWFPRWYIRLTFIMIFNSIYFLVVFTLLLYSEYHKAWLTDSLTYYLDSINSTGEGLVTLIIACLATSVLYAILPRVIIIRKAIKK